MLLCTGGIAKPKGGTRGPCPPPPIDRRVKKKRKRKRQGIGLSHYIHVTYNVQVLMMTFNVGRKKFDTKIFKNLPIMKGGPLPPPPNTGL